MLKLFDVNAHYGKMHILKGVSLKVSRKDIASLIGSNGAGKTTLMKCISGFTQISSGSIEFAGEEIHNKPYYEIVELGISQVPEGRQLFPYMTVKENIEIGSYLRKEKNEKLKDMEFVYSLFPRLKERKRQLAGTLSGGEQQMVAIARGLMSKPRLLLFDEPSLGLAPLVVMEVFGAIKELNKAGRTVFLVEQNANLALQLSNRAYVIENGKVVMDGEGKELLSNDHVKRAYLGM